MRIIDSSILAELQNKQLRPFILIEMYIDSIYYRYTNCDVPIALGLVQTGLYPNTNLYPSMILLPGPTYVPGALYTPRGFSIGAIQYSSSKIVDSVEVDISNLSDEESLSPVFIGGNPVGSDFLVRLVVLDINYRPIGDIEDPSVLLFKGLIDRWELDEEHIAITVASLFTDWSQTTLSRHPPSCRWKIFKGLECRYLGVGDTCDRSYAQCTAYSNTDHFGGFRWLPSIEEKEIWWGRVSA